MSHPSGCLCFWSHSITQADHHRVKEGCQKPATPGIFVHSTLKRGLVVRRRKIDGCPIASALQLIGDKWTMLVVRDLFAGPKRTTELLEDLHPISSRTLMGRLREMEQDDLVLRNNYGGLPRRVEYELTERGRRLIPVLDALMKAGQALECNDCQDRKKSAGYYCDFCPARRSVSDATEEPQFVEPPPPEPAPRRRDDSIILL